MSPRIPTMPPAIDAERTQIDTAAGALSYYAAGQGEPLLLIHSINAAASAYEVRPVFEHYRRTRRVVALDLPGFGFSERSDRPYTIALYTQAIAELAARLAEEHEQPVDALALSLSCEFLARAAVTPNQPGHAAINRLAMVTPTGFRRGDDALRGAPGHSREIAWLSGMLNLGFVGAPLFRLLTRPGTIRYFLKRTWGSDRFDRGLADYDAIIARQPGAQFAPLAFVSGKLFSRDVRTLYEALEHPVFLGHGTRGDFKDFRGAGWTDERDNWIRVSYDTGAFPHFEQPQLFFGYLDRFFATTSATQ